ncbi:dienelactone hydrolase family protein [Marivibrio halodurans]|uniref:Dienelactone hydrolase family protein n=1 Tax=Marivibrio halodurans TaxID=2039722 RepID=A0A8J7S3A3_9PROT|nr:dienelactone hydrolase family protein [Marivibrio halodurans]MBP5859060.1 dienelactone hydrolase family protein [Marivibrio halodurans]
MTVEKVIDRRGVLRGMAGGVAGTATLATILADPTLARAAAAGLEDVSLTLSDGTEVGASLAMPEGASQEAPVPSIILIHEWWGLNDQIKAVAAELAKEGYAALAIDLMNGKVATTADKATRQMKAVDEDEATATCAAWIDWLRAKAETTDKLGTVGWCFGGGWSLNASLAAPVDGTVIYYGRVNKEASELAALQGPVLGHFATQDKYIDEPMVSGFVEAMEEAGKSLTVYWYEADHAFANPTGARYDEADARLAWGRTTSFFTQTLRSDG